MTARSSMILGISAVVFLTIGIVLARSLDSLNMPFNPVYICLTTLILILGSGLCVMAITGFGSVRIEPNERLQWE